MFSTFSNTGEDKPELELFGKLATNAKRCQGELSSRLHSLGADTAAGNNFLSRIFGEWESRGVRIASGTSDRAVERLSLSFSALCGEVARYEALTNIAEAAGDSDTESLARFIGREERAAADMVGLLLKPAARREFELQIG